MLKVFDEFQRPGQGLIPGEKTPIPAILVALDERRRPGQGLIAGQGGPIPAILVALNQFTIEPGPARENVCSEPGANPLENVDKALPIKVLIQLRGNSQLPASRLHL